MLKSYLRNKDGNFAIMFSIGGALLAMGVAVAVDVAGMTNARQNLQNVVDSAALSAVIEVATGEFKNSANSNSAAHKAKYEEVVQAALATSDLDLQGVSPTITLEDNALIVELNFPYTLQFGGLLGKKTSDIGAFSKISLPGSGEAVEVALVLDNTASMNYFGKMDALREGARDFIEAIDESNSGSKIALVPFARYVDIGEDKRGEPWLDVPLEFDTNRIEQKETRTGGTCVPVTVTNYDDGIAYTYESTQCTGQTITYEDIPAVVESRWIGCVGVRSNELHLVDQTYSTTAEKIPGLLHINPTEVTGFSHDEESWCPDTVTPLTDDYDLLDNRIGTLYGTDRTYIPMGLIWGQRILSPQAPFTEADTATPKRQIMILMSDGNNTAYLEDIGERESIPYIQDLNKAEQAAGTIPPGTNEDTAALCASIKAEGIEMYTIAFRVEHTVTENLLRNCASSPQHYFDAGSNTALVETFQAISKTLETDIRIMR